MRLPLIPAIAPLLFQLLWDMPGGVTCWVKNLPVTAVIGDGALTGGMAYEALNNAARMDTNLIIILNDNKMSISENVGGVVQVFK